MSFNHGSRTGINIFRSSMVAWNKRPTIMEAGLGSTYFDYEGLGGDKHHLIMGAG